jgi:hypothetical protein
MSKEDEEWNFKHELEQLLADPSTDFTDAVIVLPKEKSIIHQSTSLNALGVLEWCKQSLCEGVDDDYETPEETTHTKPLH